MSVSFTTIGMLVGGLGLFLLAVGMITDGLRFAAGNALKDLLSQSTRTPAHGIVSGITITAIVQSSSAVTVATIGFVNAGLLSMYQALGIVYGSNIGTTMTGWLVAIIGFKIKVELFALPMVGLGMILRLTGGESRRSHLGMALAGFGLFFIGIDVLKEAFEGLSTAINLEEITVDGIAGTLMFMGIGFVMTVLTQSSSAAIAITLTAATGGILEIYPAAAMVIGANVGTTSTAMISVIGATANARRVAAAHVMFNVVTAVVALLLLPVLIWIIKNTGKVLGLQDIPAVTLALFHTVFNVLGVLLMWPLSSRLASFLERRFVTRDEIESKPRFLDQTIAQSPMLALNALALELTRINNVARRMSLAALSTETQLGKRMTVDYETIEKLSKAVSEFIGRLGRGLLTGEISEQLSRILRTQQHLHACADVALEIAKWQPQLEELSDQAIRHVNDEYRMNVSKVIDLANPEMKGFSYDECKTQLDYVEQQYEDIKEAMLRAATNQGLSVQSVIDAIEQNGRLRRLARQFTKAMRNLSEVYTVADVKNLGEDAAVSENDKHQTEIV